jgi:hypothetical protein
MKNPADIITEKLDIVCVDIGPPYKLPNMTNWAINLKYKNKKYKLDFNSKIDAENFIKESKEKGYIHNYLVNVFDSNGILLKTESFFVKSEAELFRKNLILESNKEIKEEEFKTIELIDEGFEKFLKSSPKKDNNITLIQQNNYINQTNDDNKNNSSSNTDYVNIDQLLLDNESIIKEKANNLLLSAAKFYLRINEIDNNDYLKYKLQLEQESLISILNQVEIAKVSIKKVAQQIINSPIVSPKLMDSLTSAQKFVFDVNKFQLEYIRGLEKSLKEHRDDIDSEMYGELPKVEDQEGVDVTGDLKYSDRVKLIKELNEFVQQTKSIKTPASPNTKLNRDDDQELGEVAYIKIDSSSEEKINQTNALESFDDFSE